MAAMNDFIEKSIGNTISREMITVTITLAEYRSLVAENEGLRHEVDRLRFERDEAIEAKKETKQNWENEREWWKKQQN